MSLIEQTAPYYIIHFVKRSVDLFTTDSIEVTLYFHRRTESQSFVQGKMSRDFIKKQKKKVDLKEVEKLLLQEEHSVYENARTESSQLSKLDFGSGVLYVQPEAIHTRKDGARGVYIYLERHDMKKVAFVPLLKCKPRGETLRQQIPLFEATADDVDTKIKTIEADLEMYEEEWDASQKLIANAEMQQLEHQLIVQKALISNKKKQLEIEEAKGICIRYSLADTEGKQLTKDDIYMSPVRMCADKPDKPDNPNNTHTTHRHRRALHVHCK